MNTFKKILTGFGIAWAIASFFLIAYSEDSNPDFTIEHAAWEKWLPPLVFGAGAAVICVGMAIIGIYESKNKTAKR